MTNFLDKIIFKKACFVYRLIDLFGFAIVDRQKPTWN